MGSALDRSRLRSRRDDRRRHPGGGPCTLTVAQWRTRCATEQLPGELATWCAELAAQVTPAEVAALGLNITASDLGELPEGLGEMRFTHPMRSDRTLREHLTGYAQATPEQRDRLAALAFDANRAFEGCVDHGVLKPTVTRELCFPDGVTGPIVGPEGFACQALDNECSRGVLRPEGCCDVRPRPNGMLCGAAGQCVGGQCLPLGTLPDPPDYAPVAFDGYPGVVGTEHWIDGTNLLPDRESRPWFEWVDPRTLRIYEETTPIADLPIGDGLGLQDVRVVPPREDGAVGVLAPSGVRALWVDLKDADQVCVVAGDPTDPRVAWSDCVGRGVPVPCPSTGEFSCERIEDRARITGPDLILAWPLRPGPTSPPQPVDRLDASFQLPPSATPIHDDVFTRLGVCVEVPGLGCVDLSGPPPCPIGDVRSCRLPCGLPSVQFCGVQGWGNCLRNPFVFGATEDCNFRDDDCDGRIDEDVGCDDGLSCTRDRCTYLGGFATCLSTNEDSCSDDASCTQHLCQRTPPSGSGPFPGRSVAPSPSNPLCHVVSDHLSCQNGCDCDGAERCEPARDPDGEVPGTSFDGCVAVPSPCNVDDNRCTIEGCIPEESQREACGFDAGQWTDLVLRRLRRRDLTSMQPWDPSDPSRQVECVAPERTTIAGRHYTLFAEVDCDDGNECTLDQCRTTDGVCERAFQRSGHGCSLPLPPGVEWADLCGPTTCDDAGACLRRAGGTDRGTKNFTCEEKSVEGPVVPRGRRSRVVRQFWRRLRFHEEGERVRYEYIWYTSRRIRRDERHRQEVASCHLAQSCGDGICGVRSDGAPGTQSPSCPPAPGCLVNECVRPPRTDVAVGSVDGRVNTMVIGCQTIPNPNLCWDQLPDGNECLQPTCSEDGTCGVAAKEGFCQSVYAPVQCVPGGPRHSRYCNTRTGRCEEPCGLL